MNGDNPFSQLFASGEAVQKASEIALAQKLNISDILTRIFLFTNESESSKRARDGEYPVAHVIQLPQLCIDDQLSGGEGMLQEDNISQGLAERLQLTFLPSHLVHCQSSLSQGLYSKEMALESSPLHYLAHSYVRANKEALKQQVGVAGVGMAGMDLTWLVQRCKELIGEMAGPVVMVRQLRECRITFADLLLQTLSGKTDLPSEFFSSVAHSVANSQSLHLLFGVAFDQVFDKHKIITSLSTPSRSLYFDLMLFFSSNSCLAKLLTSSSHWSPSAPNGKSFENTLLGKLLSPSTLSLSFITPSEHFPIDRPFTQTEVDSTTSELHWQLTALIDQAEKIITNLLRSDAEVKKAVIKWLVCCFEANSARSQMAYRLQSGFESMRLASDGFFLNLNWVLLRLSKPLMVASGAKGLSRLNSINPAYCASWSKEECANGDNLGPLVDFSKETKLVPFERSKSSKDDRVQRKPDFQFVTHCFFLTHKSLILGMTQVVHRLEDLHRSYNRVQEVARQMGVNNANPTHPILQRCLLMQSQIFGVRAHAMHPDLLSLALSFHASTAQWLVNLTTPSSTESLSSLPMASQLKDFPECLVDNMANFAMFLRHSDNETLMLSSPLHSHFITFCTTFMGNSALIHNPHIRAKLAQLVLLIAAVGGQETRGLLPSYSEDQRQVFASHVLATEQLLPALMNIFIDIEFTGESMEFEDKFQYRLPMYMLLEFLWRIPSYRPCIETLSHQVIESLTLLETPLFLRFINMIINDATVQLDEGLESLAKVKEVEDLMASDDWAGLSEQDKKDNEQKLNEASVLAKNRNLLAQKTMSALCMITEDTWKPFVVESIVQRMANMLNYVLNMLVGPKSRQFKVKNAQRFYFKPDELVSSAITVYVNLGREVKFCDALLKDGRSFSMDLFAQARRVIMVLNKPSGSVLIAELTKLEERVKACQIQMEKQQYAFENAPEEFLDPITQEIMLDPVRLPTSGKIMDRANIIRHLLSDRTDPFNRAPLTADMLIPDGVLKAKIEQWKMNMEH